MDTSKAKKKAATKTTREFVKLEYFKVERVRVITTRSNEDMVFADLTINGVTIYSCRVANGKNGDFISYPQYKGKDGKYYNQVYVPLSDEDQKEILEQIQNKLNED